MYAILFTGNKNNNTIKKNDKDDILLKIRFMEFTTKNKKNSNYSAVFNNDPIERTISSGYFKNRESDSNIVFILEHAYRYFDKFHILYYIYRYDYILNIIIL